MSLQSEFESIFDPGLLEDMHEVDFHGTDSDGQSIGDLFIFHPPTDQPDDFVFARSEPRQVAAIEESDYLIRDGILDPDIPPADRAQALYNRRHRQCLVQNAAHSTLQSAKRLDLGHSGDPKNRVAVQGAQANLWNQLECRFVSHGLI